MTQSTVHKHTWRIFYGDGSSFSSEDGEPTHAPHSDVQFIWQDDDSLSFYHDYYLWRTDVDRWVPCSGADGLLDQLVSHVRHIDAIVVGRFLPNEQWQELFQRVLSESGKLALTPFEGRQVERRL